MCSRKSEISLLLMLVGLVLGVSLLLCLNFFGFLLFWLFLASDFLKQLLNFLDLWLH